jgi:hypothetical protein
MVGITIILVAVVGQLVLSFGDELITPALAGVTFEKSQDTVTLQISSINSADELQYRVVDAGTGTQTPTPLTWTEIGESGVGDSSTASNLDEGDFIIVRASVNGEWTVLVTTTYRGS